MTIRAEVRLKTPVHPGAFIRSEVVEPMGLSVTAASQILGVTRAALSMFLNGRSNLSPDMAIRLSKAFGLSLDTLMGMQSAYDIAQAHRRQSEIHVRRYRPSQKSVGRAA